MTTIVLARLDTSHEWTGEPYRSDMGEPAPMREVQRPRACVWLLKGGPDDIVNAQAHADSEGWHVFTFPPTERDPLGAAKRAVLMLTEAR